MFELERNEQLIIHDSTLHLHDNLTNQKKLYPIIAYPYKGSVKNSESKTLGKARILFHQNPLVETNSQLLYEGSFTNLDGTYHISLVRNYRNSRRPGLDINLASPYERESQHKNAHLILFKDSINESSHKPTALFPPSELSQQYGCGFEPSNVNEVATNEFRGSPELYSHILRKRQSSSNASSCKLTSKKVLPMGVAADCTYTAGKPKLALNNIISNWNQVSEVYESNFNIQLAIIEVKIMQSCGDGKDGEKLPWNIPCSLNFTINQRLSAFSSWRGLKTGDIAGLWHLMTRCNTGPSVGVAWLSTVCLNKTQSQFENGEKMTVSGTGVSSSVPVEWKVVAHEIGHNFGAIHDCMAETCPSNCPENSFSTQYMCANLDIPSHQKCLLNPGELKTIAAGICGNGVVEGNEECDCGSGCATDNCCDETTCKFKNGATCDQLNDDCCSNCQIKEAGGVCRSSNDFCTKEQTCDGKSATCGTSVVVPDGTPCSTKGNETGTTCASGICTSRNLQCQSLGTSGFKTVGPCPGQDDACSLLCATSKGVCLMVNGNFIDGTPCSGGGFCKNGACIGGNFIDQSMDYFKTQPTLAYPIAIAIGLVALAIIWSILRSLFGCLKNCTRRSSTASRGRTVNNRQSNNQPVGRNDSVTNWVDPSLYNGFSSEPPADIYISSIHSRQQYQQPQHSPNHIPLN
ncbi:hypothetical protein HDU92_001648 [Lobulomyces angularis]|nr:hypothetical protein HDU92_001648 [Lobulomyces angularis]